MTTPLWTKDLSILYEKKFLFEIIPSSDFDVNRKLNAVVRLSLYYSLLLYVVNRKQTISLYVPIVTMLITYVISMYYKPIGIEQSRISLMNSKEGFTDEDTNKLINFLNEDCRIPTKVNPFMNPLIGSPTKESSKENCESYNNKGLQREIDKNFNDGLYRDVNDIFGKNNSQRQFYSVPGGSIPNDQGSFAKWLYSTPPTCKEGNGLQCAANQYGVSNVRSSSSSPPA